MSVRTPANTRRKLPKSTCAAPGARSGSRKPSGAAWRPLLQAETHRQTAGWEPGWPRSATSPSWTLLAVCRRSLGLPGRPPGPSRSRPRAGPRPRAVSPWGRAGRATCPPPRRRTSQPCCGSPPGSWRSGPSGRRGRPSLVHPVWCQGARSSFPSSSGRRLAKVRARGNAGGAAPLARGGAAPQTRMPLIYRCPRCSNRDANPAQF